MATNNFDWQAVLAKGMPAGYNGGPIVTDKNTVMTPELQAALDYNKALRYQSSAQESQEADQQYGAGNYTMTQAGAIPKDKSLLQPSQAALNDASGFTVGGTATGTPNMKTHYQQNPPATGGSTGGGGATGGGGSTGGAAGGAAGGSASGLGSAPQPAASLWDVDGDQLVENRMAGLLQRGNPLLERARTQALQQANARGIINSTMAGEAATAGMLDAARSIASQDANTFASSGQFNASAKNAMADANAGRVQQRDLAQMDINSQMALAQYDGAIRKELANLDAASKRELTILDGDIRRELAAVEAKYKTQMQTSQSASELYSRTIQSITEIMTDTKLDSEAKQSRINQQMGTLADGLDLIRKLDSVTGLDEIIASLRGRAATGGGTGANTGGSTGGGSDSWNNFGGDTGGA